MHRGLQRTALLAVLGASLFATACAAGGGSTSPDSPIGTVTGTWADTYWTSNGQVAVPFNWTTATTMPTVLVPQTNGTFQTLTGTGNANGTFSIPNVPAGYFWLEAGGSSYWTSSSTVNLGQDIDDQPAAATVSTSSTIIHVNYSGLDALQSGDQAMFLWSPLSIESPASTPSGGTSLNTGVLINSDVDFSQSAPAFLLQYEPETVGTLSLLRLGPEDTIPSQSFSNGTSNVLNATLASSPQKSFDLNIEGSAWPALFTNAGPSSLNIAGADVTLAALPFMTGADVPAILWSRIQPTIFGQQMGLKFGVPLVADLPSLSAQEVPPLLPRCLDSGPIQSGAPVPLPGKPPVTTDQDFGMVSYEDPFPSTWQRVFTLCQTASVSVSLPGSANPISFLLVDSQSTSIPTSQLTPPISKVQNPMIDGASLFTAATISATGVTLSWTAPSGAAPTGYRIATFVSGTPPGGSGLSYVSSTTFHTAKTSAVLPPLQSGQTYVFIITAVLDGAANFETQPNRSALPTASVSVISAPITMQ